MQVKPQATPARWRATLWFRKGTTEWEAGKPFRFQGTPEETIERAALALRLFVDGMGDHAVDALAIQFLVSKPRQKAGD
jgi:hypothetical protein